MMNYRFSTILTIALSCATLTAALPSDFSLDQSYPENLVVNNRVLLKINGKAITLLDVTRKMDLLFYRQYPEFASSMVARYQFYAASWRPMLAAVIDDYLISADAEEKKIVINDGEVREELETLFGPDVVLNLDRLGMTLDEAFELIKTELTVQRMTSIMVHGKALTEVHPITLKEKYKEVLESNPPQDFWVYKILSIRGEGHERVAEKAYELMHQQNIPFQELAAHLEGEGVDLVYSDEYRQKEKDLSLNYKAVLETLSVGMASAPVSNGKVSRLFCLKGMERVNPPVFKEVVEDIQKELTHEAIARHNNEYRQKLRKQYGLTEQYLSGLIPDDLQPFELR